MDITAYCPVCSEGILFSSKPSWGRTTTCTLCETKLVITSLTPITLGEYYEDEEYGYMETDWHENSSLRCPLCDGLIGDEKDVKIYTQIICPDCDAVLEVCSVDPVELDYLYDVDDELV